MKNSLITLAFVLFISTFEAAIKVKGPDSIYCLELEGVILNAGNGNSACRVELLCMNILMDTAVLTANHKEFAFNLKKDKYYTLRLSMNGHVTKVICIDTEHADVPMDEDEIFYFSFETSLEKRKSPDALDRGFPVAILYYDAANEKFDYSKEYSARIRKDLYLTSK